MFSQIKPTTDYEIYIICRSTERKQHVIAKDFNLKDSLTTHIGLGIKTTAGLQIYNVSNVKKSDNGSALLEESLDEFLKIDDLIAHSIWSIKIDDKTKISKLRNLIDTTLDIKIHFDYDFTLENGEDKLYCSEFVYQLLMLSNIIDRLKPTIKKLNPFYSKALKRNELKYIPVDFFQTIDGFQKVEDSEI